MNLVADFSNSVREAAGRVFRALSISRKHHAPPVQGSLFAEEDPLPRLSASDMEALACLAMVKELPEEGDWERVLQQYGRETDKGGVPKDGVEVVTVFYIALFRTCRSDQWMPVVQCFERLKEDPWPSLELMGRGR